MGEPTDVGIGKGDIEMSEVILLMKGIAMGESPRWHEGLLWFSDWCPRDYRG